MSPMQWLQKLFGGSGGEADENETIHGFEDDSSGLWSQHMRIVLAIIVVFISACLMWWILA